jgi:hypothetical protein
MSTDTAIVPAPDNAIYAEPDGELQLDVRIDSETVWLTQAQIGQLFGVTRENINTHLANIYSEGELEQEATCKEYLQVRTEGDLVRWL